MDAATKRFVRNRAEERCEYCRLPQSAQPFLTFHLEHVIPSTSVGRTTVKVLGMNEERRVQLRADLISRGEL